MHELALVTRDRKLAMNEELLRVRRSSLTDEIGNSNVSWKMQRHWSQRLQTRLGKAHEQRISFSRRLTTSAGAARAGRSAILASFRRGSTRAPAQP